MFIFYYTYTQLNWRTTLFASPLICIFVIEFIFKGGQKIHFNDDKYLISSLYRIEGRTRTHSRHHDWSTEFHPSRPKSVFHRNKQGTISIRNSYISKHPILSISASPASSISNFIETNISIGCHILYLIYTMIPYVILLFIACCKRVCLNCNTYRFLSRVDYEYMLAWVSCRQQNCIVLCWCNIIQMYAKPMKYEILPLWMWFVCKSRKNLICGFMENAHITRYICWNVKDL